MRFRNGWAGAWAGCTGLAGEVRSELRRLARRAPLLGPRLVRAELVARFTRFHGRPPRLDPPIGFNERILHRILTDRDPRLKLVNDKLAVRELIRDRAGEAAVVPLLGVWRDPADIPWRDLPIPFAVKPSNASGRFAFVRRAEDLDPSRLDALARRWMKHDFFDENLEWGYRGLPCRILAEPLLRGPDGRDPPELQVFVFGGRAGIIRVLTGEKGTPTRSDNWYATDGTRLALRLRTKPGDHVLTVEEARRFVALAETMASDFVQMRVDIYVTGEGPRVGELTPYTLAGATPFDPPEWDERLGGLWAEAEARLGGSGTAR
jgi:hypothetical protein